MTAELDVAAVRAVARRPGLRRVLDVLDGDGEETRLVGGAVRNALLGRPVHEVDLATTALPRETARRAARAGFKTIPTGIAHGTVTVVAEGEPFEVTTLREDVETDGRRAVVRFGRDFVADAARRDFTVNALSLTRDGRLHDPVGGLADLAAGRVRFIGEARRRIREDYLRILRFFRFHADYAVGPIDPEGLDAAIRERDGLARLSRERVRAEFLKLLGAGRALETVALCQDAGLIARLLGGVCDLGRLARATDADRGAPDAVRRLAALLVRTREEADRLRETLRLSNADHARLLAFASVLAAWRSAAGPVSADDLRRAAVLHGLQALDDVAAALAGERHVVLTDAAAALLARYRAGEEAAPAFPLTGAALIAGGLEPGPAIGRELARGRAEWLAAGCPTDWPRRP